MKISISVPSAAFTVGFRNKIQCKLYEEELKGQISDGMWENSTPHDHYQVPCRAQAIVVSNPKLLGPNFMPDRSYNFASSRLLEYVGDRMLEMAKKIDKSYTMVHLRKDLTDMTKIFNHKRTGKSAPDAPTPVGVRASPIKGGDKYTWYTYKGSTPVTLNRRGKDVLVYKGSQYGLRPSSSGKDVRLIFKDEPTLVYTLTPEQRSSLLKASST